MKDIKKKKKDYYNVAICPECGRFMKKVSETDWECGNKKHTKATKKGCCK